MFGRVSSPHFVSRRPGRLNNSGHIRTRNNVSLKSGVLGGGQCIRTKESSTKHSQTIFTTSIPTPRTITIRSIGTLWIYFNSKQQQAGWDDDYIPGDKTKASGAMMIRAVSVVSRTS
ncbi:hypothetical protein FRB94_005940 [Tulasnella sp. JGI-2019a]|nr:hypothetical protein FRB94_005940 [Tulasnella sp. JGI-2019a]